MTQHDPNRIPVLAGVGEVIDRPESLEEAREPAALMVDALVRAAFDDLLHWTFT